jgi:hypothetical protein
MFIQIIQIRDVFLLLDKMLLDKILVSLNVLEKLKKNMPHDDEIRKRIKDIIKCCFIYLFNYFYYLQVD